VSAELGAVVIFDELLYKPGGQVHRWMTLLCEHFEQHAVREAPMRTGDLRAGIVSEAVPFGPRQMRGTIASLSEHSLYVLRGTGTPVRGRAGSIFAKKMFANPEGAYVELWGYYDPISKRFSRRAVKGSRRERHRIRVKGYWMAFGPDEYGPRVITGQVAGQEPNNFLFAAWRATARTHPSLRGLAPNASITEFG
jgi:hypothetical protein